MTLVALLEKAVAFVQEVSRLLAGVSPFVLSAADHRAFLARLQNVVP